MKTWSESTPGGVPRALGTPPAFWRFTNGTSVDKLSTGQSNRDNSQVNLKPLGEQ
jgi:hypothetical protein